MPSPATVNTVVQRHVLPLHQQDRTRLIEQLCEFLAEHPDLPFRLVECAGQLDRSATKIEDLNCGEPLQGEAERLRSSADIVRSLSDILADLGTTALIIARIEAEAPDA